LLVLLLPSVELPEDLDRKSPQLSARGVTLSVRFPDADGAKDESSPSVLVVPRTPLRMTGLQDNTRPAPTLGQHNATLLQSKL
jgi:crotonobetainyl-CoA:carnitine CoA-transferase CaiB-like acyl-CoA transferase